MAEPVAILHADDHLLVVDKPPRRLSVPAPGREGRSVLDLVGRQLGERLYPVHRLDEDTSGAMVLARTPAARRGLEALFRGHRVERVYLALLSRSPSPPAGRIESRLREAPSGQVELVERGGERAVTTYRVVERRGAQVLVECRPETGRRNQIRVHMAGLGCPLVGDRKYGFRGRSPFKRVMLHAQEIAFHHPFGGEEVRVRVDAPEPELRAAP